MLQKGEKIDFNSLQLVLDWYRVTGINLPLSYTRAEEAATEFKEELGTEKLEKKEEIDQYKNKDVIYKFGDGFTIVRITDPEDLKIEGQLMGHCVGGYCEKVKSGNTFIFSLRDPQNNPHVTIELDNEGIVQIQGKEDKLPIEKYRPYIWEWLVKGLKKPYDELFDYINYCPKKELPIVEKAILATNDANSIYNFARTAKGANIPLLEKAIIDTNDAEYIYYFALDVRGANKEKLLKIVEKLKSK